MSDTNEQSITDRLTRALGDDAGRVEAFLEEYYDWLRERGRNPARNQPMADNGAGNYHARIDQLYRFALRFDDLHKVPRLTQSQADELIRQLDHDKITKQSGDPYADGSKRKFSDALQKYFEWLHNTDIVDDEWEPKVVFVDGDPESADSLSYAERHLIRKAALDYGSLPAYYETDPDERDRLEGLIAQRIGKQKRDITQEDWQAADTSRKTGSLIAVTLETGMIPIEIEYATLDWYDPGKQVFVIPEEYAAKDRPTTELPLTDETADVFSAWIRERRHLDAYDDTRRIWLNQRGNPYGSGNLCYLLRQLCEEADIDHDNRKIVWYSLRHNLGQTVEDTADISTAKDQLRHQYIETTKNIYGETVTEKRRATLEEIQQTAERAATDETYNPYAPEDKNGIAVYPDLDQPTGDETSMHVDATIEDTTAARIDLIREIIESDD